MAAIPFDEQDAHSKRLMAACDHTAFDITDDNIRRSRRAYFANISYIDDKIGDIIDVLERTLQVDNTIILFLSDHGDMLGDRGLWFKMSFFEGSARVPLMMAGPNIKPGSYTDPVSTLDVTPTLAELAGISLDDVMPWTDGISLVPGFSGPRRSEPVRM